MLRRWLGQHWAALTLAALWLVFECWVSWAAFCHQPQGGAADDQGAEKDGCIFRGPVFSILRAFVRWWDHTFHEADSYVALFTALLVLSTAALWWSTRNLWRVTNATLQHAEHTSELQLRPWVAFVAMEFVRLPEDFVRATLYFDNVGKTPTRGLFIAATVVPDAGWQAEYERFYRSAVEAARQESSFMLVSLYPGENRFPISATSAPGRSFERVAIAEFQAIAAPKVIGCAFYKKGWGKEKIVHLTGFVANLVVNNDGGMRIERPWGLEMN